MERNVSDDESIVSDDESEDEGYKLIPLRERKLYEVTKVQAYTVGRVRV